ncbi:MAG: monofunctional biosynthetic peptidoglycan transglycosylase [Pseudomonadota bacterium]
MVLWLFVGTFAFITLWIAIYSILPPPVTPYMIAERVRLREPLKREWQPLEDIAPAVGRAVVAAEDANFCLHWGLDTLALRAAIEGGATRGGSTISQQTVKNLFLWHGRSWTRKGLEALITPLMEAVLTKRRILELYLNVAEFDAGVFGIEAAARHYFGVEAWELTPLQAARLAAILPDPKGRSATQPSVAMQAKAVRLIDGAETIAADGRANCFET